jgi:hypothetical protein
MQASPQSFGAVEALAVNSLDGIKGRRGRGSGAACVNRERSHCEAAGASDMPAQMAVRDSLPHSRVERESTIAAIDAPSPPSTWMMSDFPPAIGSRAHLICGMVNPSESAPDRVQRAPSRDSRASSRHPNRMPRVFIRTKYTLDALLTWVRNRIPMGVAV